MSLIIAILGFNMLVIVHEFGHYLVARLTGMTVVKFSIGFGPAIIRYHRGGTVFQFSAIPVGGYVQINGLTGEGDRLNHDLGLPEDSGSYLSKPLWKRFAMVAAGPAFNFGFAALIYVYLFSSFSALSFGGFRQRAPMNVAREVSGAAAAGGMRPYDTVERIDDVEIHSFQDIRRATGASEGRPMRVIVARPPEGQRPAYVRKSRDHVAEGLVAALPVPDPGWPRVELTITAQDLGPRGLLLGFVPDMARFGASSFGSAVRFAVDESWTSMTLMFRILGRIMKGEEKAELHSPIKITRMGADSVDLGLEWALTLLALFSINLGVINLLPLPALDGGRLAFVAIEMVARKPVPRKVENILTGLGVLLLMALMIYAVGKDAIEAWFS